MGDKIYKKVVDSGWIPCCKSGPDISCILLYYFVLWWPSCRQLRRIKYRGMFMSSDRFPIYVTCNTLSERINKIHFVCWLLNFWLQILPLFEKFQNWNFLKFNWTRVFISCLNRVICTVEYDQKLPRKLPERLSRLLFHVLNSEWDGSKRSWNFK